MPLRFSTSRGSYIGGRACSISGVKLFILQFWFHPACDFALRAGRTAKSEPVISTIGALPTPPSFVFVFSSSYGRFQGEVPFAPSPFSSFAFWLDLLYRLHAFLLPPPPPPRVSHSLSVSMSESDHCTGLNLPFRCAYSMTAV